MLDFDFDLVGVVVLSAFLYTILAGSTALSASDGVIRHVYSAMTVSNISIGLA